MENCIFESNETALPTVNYFSYNYLVIVLVCTSVMTAAYVTRADSLNADNRIPS